MNNNDKIARYISIAIICFLVIFSIILSIYIIYAIENNKWIFKEEYPKRIDNDNIFYPLNFDSSSTISQEDIDNAKEALKQYNDITTDPTKASNNGF